MAPNAASSFKKARSAQFFCFFCIHKLQHCTCLVIVHARGIPVTYVVTVSKQYISNGPKAQVFDSDFSSKQELGLSHDKIS